MAKESTEHEEWRTGPTGDNPAAHSPRVGTLRKMREILTPAERRAAVLLCLMIAVMAAFDVVGVAVIFPFMAVIGDPALVQTHAGLAWLYERTGASSVDQFRIVLGASVLATLIIAVSVKAATIWTLYRWSHLRTYSLGVRLIEGYLHQPYEWFLRRHSAELSKRVLSEVDHVVQHVLIPLLQMAAHGAVAVLLLLLLLIIDARLALTIGTVLVGAYASFFVILRPHLRRFGAAWATANSERYRAVSEAFSSIKLVKVAGLEQMALDRYGLPAKQFATHRAAGDIVGMIPRYVVEIVAIGGALGSVLYFLQKSGSLAEALPVIALYAFAGYRLLPAVQQVYKEASELRFAGAALDNLHRDLAEHPRRADQQRAPHALPLTQRVELAGVRYTYPEAEQPAVQDVSIAFRVGTQIGIVGPTGSGKTTLVDILLGLLRPQQGALKVDGRTLTDADVRAWQRNIGYVPQDIVLTDDTIAANIAFGVAPDQIDHASVERAARLAALHDVITTELPQGYQTTVGERGVRLSGGQRQRIGIARALYHRPRLLILDEATSALDGVTEAAILDAITALGADHTVVMIAHRLSTVRRCHQIHLLEGGRLAASGTWADLEATNTTFRHLIQAGHA